MAQPGHVGAAGGERALSAGGLVMLHCAPQLQQILLDLRRAGLAAWFHDCDGRQNCGTNSGSFSRNDSSSSFCSTSVVLAWLLTGICKRRQLQKPFGKTICRIV